MVQSNNPDLTKRRTNLILPPPADGNVKAKSALQDVFAAAIILISTAVIYTAEVPIQASALIIQTIALSFIYASRGVLFPTAWFLPFYTAYCVAYPLLGLFTFSPLSGTSQMALELSQIGFIAFVAAQLGTRSTPVSLPSYDQKTILDRTVHVVLILVGILALIFAAFSGATSKRELLNQASTSGISTILYGLIILSVFTCHFSAQAISTLRRVDFLSWLSIGVLFLSILVTGERDQLFRPLLVIFSLYAAYRFQWHPIALIALVAFSLLVLPLTQGLKAVFIGSNFYAPQSISDILNSEFSSAGRNLSVMISSYHDRHHGETLIWDIKRYFSIFFPDQKSTTAWYNDYVRSSLGLGGTSGWGFSFLAHGYVNFGTLGCFLWLFVLGIGARLMHAAAARTPLSFSIYLVAIPGIIYCLRGDVANLLAATITFNIAMLALYTWGRALTSNTFLGKTSR